MKALLLRPKSFAVLFAASLLAVSASAFARRAPSGACTPASPAPASARQVVVDGTPLPDFSISHTQLTTAREIVWLP